ncbi:hypothetical protein CF65_02293 [Aggregatibacter actinomycetemcomitans HK1651]|nr:hypothetical protein CF65_02293 [Aggregatibacter actinomycetemcomitans HK1651]
MDNGEENGKERLPKSVKSHFNWLVTSSKEPSLS